MGDNVHALSRLPRPLSYAASRRMVLITGSVILAGLAAIMYVRGVDPREVLATLLFVPVFLVALFFGMWGGLVAGMGAAMSYLGLRWAAINIVGFGAVAGTILSRSLSYVVFGGISGWAMAQLESPISKLERYDYIDDVTGLYNARFFLENTELESSRATRYNSTFSVLVITIPEATLAPMSAGHRVATVRRLGQMMLNRARSVDRVVHAFDGRQHLFAIVLPETGLDGARVLADAVGARIARALGAGETGKDEAIVEVRLAGPGIDGSLEALRGEFAELDRLERPAPNAG